MIRLLKGEYKLNKLFMKQHERCDRLVIDKETGLPIEAIYANPAFDQIKARAAFLKALHEEVEKGGK